MTPVLHVIVDLTIWPINTCSLLTVWQNKRNVTNLLLAVWIWFHAKHMVFIFPNIYDPLEI